MHTCIAECWAAPICLAALGCSERLLSRRVIHLSCMPLRHARRSLHWKQPRILRQVVCGAHVVTAAGAQPANILQDLCLVCPCGYGSCLAIPAAELRKETAESNAATAWAGRRQRGTLLMLPYLQGELTADCLQCICYAAKPSAGCWLTAASCCMHACPPHLQAAASLLPLTPGCLSTLPLSDHHASLHAKTTPSGRLQVLMHRITGGSAWANAGSLPQGACCIANNGLRRCVQQ